MHNSPRGSSTVVLIHPHIALGPTIAFVHIDSRHFGGTNNFWGFAALLKVMCLECSLCMLYGHILIKHQTDKVQVELAQQLFSVPMIQHLTWLACLALKDTYRAQKISQNFFTTRSVAYPAARQSLHQARLILIRQLALLLIVMYIVLASWHHHTSQ